LKAAGALYGAERYLVGRTVGARRWVTAPGVAGAVAIAFLATRLGLALIPAFSDLPVFWPATGVTTGILIVLGRPAFLAVAIDVVLGTVAANLASNRSFVTCPLNGSMNAGEGVLAAWLLER
jgi:integral membrane sensor domain MASE1